MTDISARMDATPDGAAAETISFAALSTLLQTVFRKHGCSEEVAAVLAENCTMCERDGSLSHGIFRVGGYLSSLASGWVDGTAIPVIEDAAPAFLRVNAMNGFTPVALARARALLVEKVRRCGIAALAIRNSHHFGALWPDVEPFAREGLVALAVVNSFACSVPFGAHAPVFGTNPIAFAAPRQSADPVVFDMATSSMANGDVQIAAREGRQLQPGMGVDRHGQPTTDPQAVLDGGALVPFGGYKGSALSMMIELLSAGLTGGKFSFEVDWSHHAGAQTPHTGQLIILFDPTFGAGVPFASRSDDLVAKMQEAGLSYLPGQRRYRRRREAERSGIPISAGALAELRALAGPASPILA